MKSLQNLPRRVVTSILCSTLLLILSCQKEEIVNVVPTQNIDSSDSALRFIMRLGFKKEQIVDRGSYYLVDGDIKYDKSYIPSKRAKPNHRAYDGFPLASTYSAATATVRVNNNFSNQVWYQKVVTATQEAISAWNSMNFGVHFTYESGSYADITVQYDPALDAETYGSASPPQGCGVGSTIGVNGNTASATADASRMKFLITHELGHTIGFLHTDLPQGFLIPDTPNTDINSVMKSGTGITSNPASIRTWAGFTADDMKATNFLFPAEGATITAINDTHNYPGMPLKVTWTPSRFCGTDVQVAIYYDGLFVKNAYPSTFNDGLHNFETRDLVSGREYEIRVFKVGVPNDMMYTTFSF